MAEKKQFLLRIDKKIYDALEKWANDEFRSVNGHIEYVLRDALMKNKRLHQDDKKNDEG